MPEEKGEIRLKTVVSGLIQALNEAKHLGDIESAKLAEDYKKEKALSSFNVPAFAIYDMEIELRFAITGHKVVQKTEGEVADINIGVSPASLKGLEAHQINTMKLKIAPVKLRFLEKDGQ